MKAIVAGGSIAGLFAAAAMRRAGIEAHVCERATRGLSGRGAGIVTHPELIAALRAVGAGTEALGVPLAERVALDIRGRPVARLHRPQVVTSWDRLYRLLRATLPPGAHRLGRHVTGYTEHPDGVTVRFSDGTADRADVLVGADGFRSAVRGQLQPGVRPAYAGYVVWRALAAEAALPPAAHAALFGRFAMFMPAGSQVVGYPIAGPGNDLRPGHRRYNFVWYLPVPAAELPGMLTDAAGRRHRVTIPPPLVRAGLIAALEARAAASLPPPLAAVLAHSERPFFTPIYDHWSPRMAAGRVALAGDAACVARPHVGMGVTKAALDALALARHLGAAQRGERGLSAALGAYSGERAAAAHRAWQRARRLGAALTAPDPEGRNPDGAHHPDQHRLLRWTAAIP